MQTSSSSHYKRLQVSVGMFFHFVTVKEALGASPSSMLWILLHLAFIMNLVYALPLLHTIVSIPPQ